MISEVRGAFVLAAALVCFLIFVGLMALGSVMRPGRWIERARHAG